MNNTESYLEELWDFITVNANYDQSLLDAIKEFVEVKSSQARLEENAWSRQQMIVAQALEAPNSGFGRMIKWSIDLFNKRKLELLDNNKTQDKEKQ